MLFFDMDPLGEDPAGLIGGFRGEAQVVGGQALGYFRLYAVIPGAAGMRQDPSNGRRTAERSGFARILAPAEARNTGNKLSAAWNKDDDIPNALCQ